MPAAANEPVRCSAWTSSPMLSITSGSRATIEIANRRRAPGCEAIECTAAMVRFTGAESRSSFAVVDETSQPLELLLSVSRAGSRTLGAQIEDQLRMAIRDGVLRPGARVPSTRDLARQLGISRRVAVDAYSQLAAEGYLTMRQGARPHVSDSSPAPLADVPALLPPPLLPRYDFRPSVPDVATFPRTAWRHALREALSAIAVFDLGYGDQLGVEVMRNGLADYLGRARGVIAEPARVVVTCGYT